MKSATLGPIVWRDETGDDEDQYAQLAAYHGWALDPRRGRQDVRCPDCAVAIAAHWYRFGHYTVTTISNRLVPLRDGSWGRSRQGATFSGGIVILPVDVHCPTRTCGSALIHVDDRGLY